MSLLIMKSRRVMKHNVQSIRSKVYDQTVTSNTYQYGSVVSIGTVNQLVLLVTGVINAPATKIFIKVQLDDNVFQYDFTPPDVPRSTLVGVENQIPLNTDVYVATAANLPLGFYLPISGMNYRIGVKTDNVAGSADVIIYAMQVIV